MEKIVSQLDQNGRYIGPVVADLSPLEPGVYLLPGGAVDAPPPDVPDGMYAQWNGADFDLITIPVPEPEPEPEPPTVAQACAEIDSIAEQVRLKYITPGAGQAATYITKQMQAEKYKAAGYAGPVPSFVQAEADSLGATPQEGADYILAAAALWEAKGAEIERVRRVWKLWMVNHSTNTRADLLLARAELEAL